MTTHIALLRGINVGNNTLKMERLRQICADLGLKEARTYLQSGNVLFDAETRASDLAARIETAVSAETRLPVTVLIRTPAQLQRVIAANPFARERGIAPNALHVTFLPGPVPKAGLAALAKLPAGADRWHAEGAEIHLCCPNGYGRSKLNNPALERALGMRTTTRNWNTVTALMALAAE